jgi:hypothetical protein
MGVILRSKATKNLIVTKSAEILRGACPEPVEGLRMTWSGFRMETSSFEDSLSLIRQFTSRFQWHILLCLKLLPRG